VAKDDDKTDKLNSVESSQWRFEISGNNRWALNEELTDKTDNDNALTTPTQNNHQNRQKHTHDPRALHDHTEDIAPDEAMGIPSLNKKSP